MAQAATARRGRPSNAEKARRAAAEQAVDHGVEGDYSAEQEVAATPLRRNRPDPRAQAREPVREDNRQMNRSGGQVRGRDGEVLTRSRRGSSDEFHVPAEAIPRGWTYQWNVMTVHNEQMESEQAVMFENGWRPVMHERHPGLFGQVGKIGPIIRKGLRLEERPVELTLEATQELYDEACRPIRDAAKKLKLGVEDATRGTGFSTDRRGAGISQLNVQHAPDPEAQTGRGGYKYEQD